MAVFTGNGSAGSPSFTFSSDTDTGIFRPADNVLAVATDGQQRITVTSDGKLGIFDSLPAFGVSISTNTVALGVGGQANTVRFRRQDGNIGGYIGYEAADDTTFGVYNGSGGGGVTIGGQSGDIIVESAPGNTISTFVHSGEYLRMASGTGGIQFNGDAAAANALDDYEEGSFTPTFLDSGAVAITTTSVACKYIKIGNQVTCWGKIVAASGISGSVDPYLVVRGLPKAVGATSPTPAPTGFGSASQSISSGLDRKPMFVRAETSFAANNAFLYRGETNFTGGTIFNFVVTYRTID